MHVALVGNQNCGKTTLFNQLTGSNQHVGNWAGVTVEKKSGIIKKAKDIEVVDLPGIYSFSPYTLEEIISRDYVLSDECAGVINIVDATNINRNLYLTLQLVNVGKPMIVALNMMDQVKSDGDIFNIAELEKALGIRIIPISARKGEGITELVQAINECVAANKKPPITDICSGSVHEALHSITHLIENKAHSINVPARYAATHLIEGDSILQEKLGLEHHELHIINEIVELMEHKLGTERDAAIADARYQYIDNLVNEHIRLVRKPGEMTFSNKIDSYLTHKIFALPIFAGIMMLIFWITFGPVGSFLSDNFATLLENGVGLVSDGLKNAEVASWVHALVVDGVLAGISGMLGFLPVIILLFLFLSVMEDTGYMARAAFVMDKFLSNFGLSGRAFFPMIMGFGCSVPAIMATRTMNSQKERRLTILVTPFMSCAARVPIYGLFIAAFFDKHGALVMSAMYFIGIIIAIICSFFLKDAPGFKSDKTPFVLELPTYRLPTLKTVIRLLWDKSWDFIQRAFTIIFAATVIIWFLSSFNSKIEMIQSDPSQGAVTVDNVSLLEHAGSVIAPVFAPLGFGTWEAATAIITGFTAKEAVVSTMAVLYKTNEDDLPSVMGEIFTPLTAWSFMIFCLLYLPCSAAFAAMKRELGKWRYAFGAALFQTGVAWVVSFLVFQIGRLFV